MNVSVACFTFHCFIVNNPTTLLGAADIFSEADFVAQAYSRLCAREACIAVGKKRETIFRLLFF